MMNGESHSYYLEGDKVKPTYVPECGQNEAMAEYELMISISNKFGLK